MFIVESYALAVLFCLITMICWGSWANTQKLVQKQWRFELFYWDYVLGILVFALIGAFTMGSIGELGRPFLEDLKQADASSIRGAIIGGIVFNLANILLTAAIASAGMAVAFPIGIGIALVIGVLLNYLMMNKGDPLLLFSGVVLITIAIVVNAFAYGKHQGKSSKKAAVKWIAIAALAGILMSTFYPFIAGSMDITNFQNPRAGKMTPYTAFVVFAVGIVAANFIFNTILMRKPLEGKPISYSEYFKGKFSLHMVGLLGGVIWGLGNLFNLIAAGKAGPAISYGLGQGATLIAALWGVFIWKDFKGSGTVVQFLIVLMFLLFIPGLGLVVLAGEW